MVGAEGVGHVSRIARRIVATLTGEQFEQKMRKFANKQPEAVRKALRIGSNDMLGEVRRRYNARLRKRSGKLYKAIKILSLKATGTEVRASVGVDPEQAYKAVTHELGAVHNFKGGQPYIPWPSGNAFVSRSSPMADTLPKTQPYSVRIPARPFVNPAKEAKIESVKQLILDELMEAYKRA